MKILCDRAAAFIFALGFGLSAAEAGVNLSNVPLQTGATVAPNLMFILDDSGSMMWESMPDDLTYKFGISALSLWLFPRVDGLHGNDYDTSIDQNATIPFSGDLAAEFRSSHTNKIYYDPAVTYAPWVNANGSVMANSASDAALNRPLFPAMGTRNLTVDNTWSGNWRLSNGQMVNESRTFYPAVYYHFIGGDVTKETSYQRVEIKPTNAPFSGHGRELTSADGTKNRADCAIHNACTYQEEMQNFANWYTYHRNRVFASRAGIGRAFSQIDGGIRVGYATINTNTNTVDGVDGRGVVTGVREFTGAAKLNFFENLYTRPIPASGTPLRRALSGVGEYFRRADSSGPWSETPGSASNLAQLTCRQNFALLMTDGYWTGGNNFAAQVTDARDNNDGTTDNNTVNVNPNPNTISYSYPPQAPFMDGYSNTLADIAMYYWKRDLRSDMTNNVPTNSTNPAFWQHMVTFGMGLGVQGNIPPQVAFDAIAGNSSVPWPDPVPSLDNCGVTVGVCAARIDDLLHASVNSRGGFFSADRADVFAKELSKTLSQIVARVASASNLVGATTSLETNKQIFQGRFFSGDWTGDLWGYSVDNNSTPNWKASTSLNSRSWESRKIFYSKQLGNNPGADFTGTISPLTQDQVNYIRGDRSKELNKPGGTFRIRNSILGDIAHSSPFYVGAPENRFYERFGTWDSTELESYSSFLDTNKNRSKAVYVGSNNGMLHAFNAINGEELFAFIPNEMLPKLPALTSQSYQHQFYVDGSVTVADAYVNNSWRSVLVGVNGRGGRNVFALDVTRPESFNASRVLWEKAIPELGFYTGQAIIAKVPVSNNSTKWYAILGNGVNSQNHTASLILIPLDGGAHQVITAATGTAATPNGLFQPEGFDVDNTGIVTRVYAGDLRGNIWEFDLTNGSRTVAYSGLPLFVAKDSQGNRQAVTGGMTIAQDGLSGNTWLYFGTGKYLETKDQGSVQPQSWYGLILPNTNIGTPKGGGKKNPVIINTPITGRSELAQRIISNVGSARVVSEVSSIDGKRGWFMDLPDQGERITSTPQMIGSTLVMNTMVPKADQCSPEGFGYVMAVDPFEGTRLKRNFFDIDGNKVVDDQDRVTHNGQSVVASGLRFDSAPGQPIFYQDIMKVSLENADVIDVVVDTESRLGRVSWREVVN